MRRPINLGISGYSLNAIEHKIELETHPVLSGKSKLIAGFDPDPSATERLNKLEGVKAAKSFEDLLDTKDIKAILISSPPQHHADQAVAALESGLHVFSEVPMALNEKDINRIVDAEESTEKIYQLGENYCFYSEVLYAANLTASKKIGEPVYVEAEYLHDVTYRWREKGFGDVDIPRVDFWYQLFDPMMYAHSIGPAQVVLGGINKPMPFIKVTSFFNDIGGFEGKPICAPAKAFQVALFQTETSAIAKCANAYIVAREPARISIQVIGRIGSYECYQIDKPGMLFLANGHKINRFKHRKGETSIIDQEKLSEVIPLIEGFYSGANVRVIDEWFQAINEGRKASIHAKIAANFCLSGIQASESAHSGGKPKRIKIFT